MKEISEIIQAYRTACRDNLQAALATVVKVEGSSYRQAGARMLVTENGNLTGAISGGCLEGNALRKALLAINQKQNKLITYDTSNADDAEFGVQLGCNGVVHILFEYINADKPNNPIELLSQLQDRRQEAMLITLFSLDRRANQKGTVLLAGEQIEPISNYPEVLDMDLMCDVQLAMQQKRTIIKKIPAQNLEALLEYVAPTVSLVIAGAGNDAKSLVEAASLLGWEVTVADGRATHVLARRFPKAKKVLLATPEELMRQITIDASTVFVLMTHNYKYDVTLLKLLLGSPSPYIGTLGPKTKLEQMVKDMKAEGIGVSENQYERIYGPVGLDIGAETSEEIAIAVIAEVKAVLSGKMGTSLKFRKEKIHTDMPVIL